MLKISSFDFEKMQLLTQCQHDGNGYKDIHTKRFIIAANILCTLSLAISDVSHLFVLIFVQYRTL